MMKRVCQFFLFFLFFSVGFFVVDTKFVFARVNQPIGRACLFTVRIQGIDGVAVERFASQNLTADQIVSQLEDSDLCEVTLDNPDLNADSLFQKYYAYEFGDQISWYNVIESFFVITPAFSQKFGGTLYFNKQGGYFEKIDNWESKNVESTCFPFPEDVLIRLIDKRFSNVETVPYNSGLVTNDLVTLESCPIGQITTSRLTPLQNLAGFYFLIGASIQEGRLVYPNESLEPEEKIDAEQVFSLPFSAKNCTNDLNPLGCITIPQLIGKIISLGLGVLGTFALLWFIYAGLLWMFAGGNTDRSSRALKMLLWGALGLIVIFASYAVVTFVFQAFV